MDSVRKTSQAIAMLYTAGDVEGLKKLWHPEIQIATRAGRMAAGKTRTAEVVSALQHRHVDMRVDRVETDGVRARLEGYVVTPGGVDVPVCWELIFRDGLLWRSSTVPC